FAELSSRVQAVVEMSGPTDLTRPFPDWVMVQKELVFGAEQWVSASPVTHVHASAPPFLIVHGDADPAVPVEQANLLYEALIRAGAPAELLTLHNAGHGLEPLAGEMRPSAEEMFGRIIGFLTHCLA
ncbi:MAG TPA: prolyl oligopeptidase family serine peptidase, partial [Anaerolinea sp.]|nr:prolyl oligopeptidase family serine peptidase [Anaerolinea sp.]